MKNHLWNFIKEKIYKEEARKGRRKNKKELGQVRGRSKKDFLRKEHLSWVLTGEQNLSTKRRLGGQWEENILGISSTPVRLNSLGPERNHRAPSPLALTELSFLLTSRKSEQDGKTEVRGSGSRREGGAEADCVMERAWFRSSRFTWGHCHLLALWPWNSCYQPVRVAMIQWEKKQVGSYTQEVLSKCEVPFLTFSRFIID